MDDKRLTALPIGLLTGLAPMFALPCALALPAVGVFLIIERRRIYWETICEWYYGAFIGSLVTFSKYPWSKFHHDVQTYQMLYNKIAVKPMGLFVLDQPIELLKRMFLISDFDLFWNHYAAAPFFWIVFGVAAWHSRGNLLSRFALCLWVSYVLFSMSYYPVVLMPFFVAAACVE